MEENVLDDFLRENRAEVVKVTQLDYTFDRQIMLEREDAREEGKEEGREEGRKEECLTLLRNLISNGVTPEEAKRMLGVTEDDIKAARSN